MDNALASWSERSPCLQDDQPFTGTTSAIPGRKSEAEVHTHRTASSSSLNGNGLHWLNSLPLPEFSRRTHLLAPGTLYLTGCGLHCRQALLPRDRKTAPQSAIFRARHSTGASLCIAHSDKVTHEIHATAPVNPTAPAHDRILTLTFQPF
ncbi:hypothetical protein CIT292_09575 [Citrobacter youngae ATCC 29220]|uniref:Uncharacterized protein n=1 Tax=Citrobacter youngae ATCC 29220 TaxID=500640 RepID=D4BGC8_9ENTR|nr:hypothetical protein CIT292_09575 [Citrobacter youngae ATCC 29220]